MNTEKPLDDVEKIEQPLRNIPVVTPELRELFEGIETSKVFNEEPLYKNFASIRRKKE